MKQNTCLECGKPIGPKARRCRTHALSEANRKRWQGNDPRRAKLKARNDAMRNGNKPYTNREWLRSRYEDQGMSLREVAKDAQCGIRTIARWMGRHSIPTRDMRVAIRARPSLKGPKSPMWKGGRPPCPECGGPKVNRISLICQSCYSKRRQGSSNPNWRGLANVMVLVRGWCAEHWRPHIFKRDHYTCQECGDSRGGNLHAHHVTPLATLVETKRHLWTPDLMTDRGRTAFVRRLINDPDIASPDTGITLCETCHQIKHKSLHVFRKKRVITKRKVSIKQHKAIRHAYAEGAKQSDIAKQYGISQTYVSLIIRSL